MKNSNMQVWKELYAELQEAVAKNEVVLEKSQKRLQEKENESKAQLLALFDMVKQQNSRLESINQQIQECTLTGTADTADLPDQERIAKNRDLIELATEILSDASGKSGSEETDSAEKESSSADEDPEPAAAGAVSEINTKEPKAETDAKAADDTSEKGKSVKENSVKKEEENGLFAGLPQSVVPAETKREETQTPSGEEEYSADTEYVFNLDMLLGNWIHHFDENKFTCQSFWADGVFKEYDFQNGTIAGESGGTFTVKPGKLILDFDDREDHQLVYNVKSCREDSIDYVIGGQEVGFEYIEPEILNKLLNDAD